MPPIKLTRPRSQSSQDLEAAWRAKRGAVKIPQESQVDLLDLPDLLNRLAKISYRLEPNPVFEVLFAGSGIRDMMGSEITGLNAADLFGDSPVEVMVASLEGIFATGCGLVQLSEAVYQNVPSAVMEVTAFPLLHKDKPDRTLIVNVLRAETQLGEDAETPVLIRPAFEYEWIDTGFGVPDV